MVLLQKVNPSMFCKVYPLLQKLDASLGENTWYRIFSYQWRQAENYCGYGLFDKDEIVGFLGLIFSQRNIHQSTERFCNISSWIVKESYRGYSLTLMHPLIKLKDYTLTDLSSLHELFPLARRMGFQKLDAKLTVLSPFFLPGLRKRLDAIQIVHNPELIQVHLGPSDLTLFSDHQSYDCCHHLLIRSAAQSCYVIYTVQRSHFPYCYIQSISNPDLFAQQSLEIRSAITDRHRLRLLLVDSRLVKNLDLPWTVELPMQFTKLYKSERLAPQQIDNLYSELVLLNFNLLPHSIIEIAKEIVRPKAAY
jgi:hypothetical protein